MNHQGGAMQTCLPSWWAPAVLAWALVSPFAAYAQEQPAAPASSRLPLRTAGADDSPMAAVGPMIAVLGIGALGLWVWIATRGRGAGGLRLGRWLAAGPDTPRLQVLERAALMPGCTLCVVRWGENEILLACSDKAVTLVSQRPVPVAAPGPQGEEPS